MKKLKLITTLSGLGVVAAATPIIATSCSKKDKDVQDFDKIYYEGLEGPVTVYPGTFPFEVEAGTENMPVNASSFTADKGDTKGIKITKITSYSSSNENVISIKSSSESQISLTAKEVGTSTVKVVIADADGNKGTVTLAVTVNARAINVYRSGDATTVYQSTTKGEGTWSLDGWDWVGSDEGILTFKMTGAQSFKCMEKNTEGKWVEVSSTPTGVTGLTWANTSGAVSSPTLTADSTYAYTGEGNLTLQIQAFADVTPVTGATPLDTLTLTIEVGDPVAITGTNATPTECPWTDISEGKDAATWDLRQMGTTGATVQLHSTLDEAWWSEITSIVWTLASTSGGAGAANITVGGKNVFTIDQPSTTAPAKLTASQDLAADQDFFIQVRGVASGSASPTSPIIGELKVSAQRVDS